MNRELGTANFRRVLALACLIAIVAIRIEPRLLRLPFIDRKLYNEGFLFAADGGWREFTKFLQGVREHTQIGDRIVVLVPPQTWDDGYSYAYYRSSYFLSGRIVLPLLTEDDKQHPENVREANYIAAWRIRRLPPLGRIAWFGHEGVLLRR